MLALPSTSRYCFVLCVGRHRIDLKSVPHVQHADLVFFLIRPITFLVYRVVLAYVVIDAKALEYFLHPDL